MALNRDHNYIQNIQLISRINDNDYEYAYLSGINAFSNIICRCNIDNKYSYLGGINVFSNGPCRSHVDNKYLYINVINAFINSSYRCHVDNKYSYLSGINAFCNRPCRYNIIHNTFTESFRDVVQLHEFSDTIEHIMVTSKICVELLKYCCDV